MRSSGLRSVSSASEGFEERQLLFLHLSKRDGVDRLEVRRVREEQGSFGEPEYRRAWEAAMESWLRGRGWGDEKGRTGMGDVISEFWITFDLVEGRGRREFEGVGELVQWQR